MSNNALRLYIAWCLILTGLGQMYAQQTEGGALPDTGEIEILHSDNLFFQSTKEGVLNRLVGHVKLLHDSTYMLCDSALLLGKHMDAYGHVVIIQGDSTRIFSDTLIYDGEKHHAELFGHVVLQDGTQELFTSQLHYDLINEVGTYPHSALLTDSTTYLRSMKGRYYVRENYVYFEDSVTVVDTGFVLQADSLKYHTREDRAYFIGPTRIDADSSSIYCEGGWYDFPTRDALFTGHPIYEKGNQKAIADTIRYAYKDAVITLSGGASVTEPKKTATAEWIEYHQRTKDILMKEHARYEEPGKKVEAEEIFYNSGTEVLRTKGRSVVVDGGKIIKAMQMDYDKSAGMSIAEGDVIVIDTVDHYELHCDKALHNRKTGYMKATGKRPWIVQRSEEDSIYIGADTILSRRVSETDSSRLLTAWEDVKMYSNDFQGVCDSLIWYEMDSSFELLKHPVLWSDTSQFVGDTIRIFVRHGSIHQLHQINHAFIINSNDEILFNQLKGRVIKTLFSGNEPKRSYVKGNAEVVYYLVDDQGAYVAANKTECGEMRIDFKNKKIDIIHFFKQPKGEMKPLTAPGVKDWRLKGFRWNTKDRPKSIEAVITPDYEFSPSRKDGEK